MNTPDTTYLEPGFHQIHADLGLDTTDNRLYVDHAGGVHVLPPVTFYDNTPDNLRDVFCSLVVYAALKDSTVYDEKRSPEKISHAITDAECAKIRRLPNHENAYFLKENPFGTKNSIKVEYDPVTNQPRCYILYTVTDAEEWLEVRKDYFRNIILAQFHKEILPKPEPKVSTKPKKKLHPEVVHKEVIQILDTDNVAQIATYTRLVMEGYFVIVRDEQTGEPVGLSSTDPSCRPGADARWRTLHKYYNRLGIQ